MPAHLYWTDATSTGAERDAYLPREPGVHSLAEEHRPAFTGMDYEVYPWSTTTAAPATHPSGGGGLNFCAEGAGCNNMAQVADVVYHEYHHIVTVRDLLALGAALANGMNEGFSDCCAMMLTNTYCMAQSYLQSNPDGCMRSGLNLRQYPGTECSGEVHCLGEILMGGFWKVRRNLLAKYGDGLRDPGRRSTSAGGQGEDLQHAELRHAVPDGRRRQRGPGGRLPGLLGDLRRVRARTASPARRSPRRSSSSTRPCPTSRTPAAPVVVNGEHHGHDRRGHGAPRVDEGLLQLQRHQLHRRPMANLGSGNYQAPRSR